METSARLYGMMRSLENFKLPTTRQGKPKEDEFELNAIDHETGEIRTYRSIYYKNILYSQHTDYMVYGNVKTTYIIQQFSKDYPDGMVTIDQFTL